MFTPQYKQTFDQNGYVVVPHLFSRDEVDAYIDHYMHMNARAVGAHGIVAHSLMAGDAKDPGDWRKYDSAEAVRDPLSRYPRMLQMHRTDPISLSWLLNHALTMC